MRIELFENLFANYSTLALTNRADRPVAIRGLETRLIDHFDTTGGFGVFDEYLHRCLLWKRAGGYLERITSFRRGYQPPSWSWMAYDGAIDYMPIPFGETTWFDDISSPFRRHKWHPRPVDSILELEAPVRKLTGTLAGEVTIDERDYDTGDLMCVVVGKSKARTHYVLLVRPLPAGEGGRLYDRVGVAALDYDEIVWEGQPKMSKIR
jgi:hypothetical protein